MKFDSIKPIVTIFWKVRELREDASLDLTLSLIIASSSKQSYSIMMVLSFTIVGRHSFTEMLCLWINGFMLPFDASMETRRGQTGLDSR